MPYDKLTFLYSCAYGVVIMAQVSRVYQVHMMNVEQQQVDMTRVKWVVKK